MRAILLFLAMFNSIWVFAQQDKIDSLMPLLKKEREDTSKAMMLSYLSYCYLRVKPDTSLKIASTGLELSLKRRFLPGQAVNLNQLGNVYWYFGNYPLAIDSYQKSKNIAEVIKDTFHIAICLSNISLVYDEQKDHTKALEYAFLARKVLENVQGGSEKLNNDLNIARYYWRFGMYDSAAFYAQQGYGIARRGNDDFTVGIALHLLGAINANLGNYTIALEYLRTAVPYFPVADVYMRAELLLETAKLFGSMRNYDSSIYYARQAHHLAKISGNLKSVLESSQQLAIEFENIHSLDSAFIYQKVAMRTSDSLFSLEKTKAINNMELQEERRKADIEDQLTLAKKQRKHNLQYAAIAIALLLFILIYFAFSYSIVASPKIIKFVGVISLLMVFEFLNLLLHPSLGSLTHHSPILMLLIMVCIAALLVPVHHRLEQWILINLVEKNKRIRLAAAKKTLAELEEK